MMRILFVDDEPNILSGLKRMLHSERQEWAMTFVAGADEALAVMSQTEFHVIVSDMRMPGMNGAELLSIVSQRYPEIMQIVLSGQADKEHLEQLTGFSHEYLSKPCDADRLKAAITRAYFQRNACATKDSLR